MAFFDTSFLNRLPRHGEARKIALTVVVIPFCGWVFGLNFYSFIKMVFERMARPIFLREAAVSLQKICC